MFLLCKLWITDVSLLVRSRFVDGSLKIHWRYSEDFDGSINDLQWFFDLMSETSLFPCCFVDDSLMIIWRDIFEALIISMETFLIFIVFVVLTSESFMFHCFFLNDWLMTLRKNIDDTTEIWIQTVKIIEVYNVIIIRTLMFPCCLID